MSEIVWHGATIAWARPSESSDFTAADLAEMGHGQSERHRLLDAVRAARFLAGRRLIRDLVRRLGGGPAVPLDSVCVRCGEDHAAPRTPGFVISVSHADGLVAVGVAPGTAPLGIDLERNSDQARVAELGPLFAPEPVPDLAGWTRIEAAVKADGRGIAIDPSAVRLAPEPPAFTTRPSDPSTWTALLPRRTSPLRVATLDGPAGYTLSVARG